MYDVTLPKFAPTHASRANTLVNLELQLQEVVDQIAKAEDDYDTKLAIKLLRREEVIFDKIMNLKGSLPKYVVREVEKALFQARGY